MSETTNQAETWQALPPPVSQDPYNISTYEWSDGEDGEKPSNDESKYQFDLARWFDMKLLFGKYKGLTLRDMILKKERRRYLRWLATSDFKLYGNQRECVKEGLRYYKRVKSRRAAKLALSVFE